MFWRFVDGRDYSPDAELCSTEHISMQIFPHCAANKLSFKSMPINEIFPKNLKTQDSIYIACSSKKTVIGRGLAEDRY